MRKKFLFLALALAMCLGLAVPAMAAETKSGGFTHTKLNLNRNNFVFEGGIVKVDAERAEGHSTSGGAVTMETHMFWDLKAVYIPKGSKVTLAPLAVRDGYKMVVYHQDDFNTIVYADELTSYRFDTLGTLEIGIYNEPPEGSYCLVDFVDIVVVNEPAPKFPTPFIDIGYFGEEYKTTDLNSKKVLINISQKLREDIEWAYANGVASGTSAVTFSPFSYVTRSQMVQMLWNFSDKPEPQYTRLPFTDVKETDRYYKALCWAYETGVLENMYSADAFHADWNVAPPMRSEP